MTDLSTGRIRRPLEAVNTWLAVLGGLTTLIGFGLTLRVAGWAWALTFVLLLTHSFLITLVLSYRREALRAQQRYEREASSLGELDTIALNHLQGELDDCIQWLRDQPLRGPFPHRYLEPLDEAFQSSTRPDNSFVDSDLERLRKALFEAISELTAVTGTYLDADLKRPDAVRIDRKHPDPTHLKTATERLDGAGENVVLAYDQLVGRARGRKQGGGLGR